MVSNLNKIVLVTLLIQTHAKDSKGLKFLPVDASERIIFADLNWKETEEPDRIES